MKQSTRIRIGTASWSDPGFIAEWYPEHLKPADRLRYYADRFNLVELNSSFYSIPSPRNVERWCGQTPEGFLFDVKLHKLLSRHSTSPDDLPTGIRNRVTVDKKRVRLTPELESEVTEAFLTSISPIEECGKLGSLLLQLSPSFSPRTNELTELDHLISLLHGRRLSVELRNRGWLNPERFEETLDFFDERKITFVCVDAPQEHHFMVMPSLDVVTNPELAYIRMHGRNREGYVKGRTVATRFDYDYKEEELQEHAQRVADLAEEAATVHVVYNNNKGAYAPLAAQRLLEIVSQQKLPIAA